MSSLSWIKRHQEKEKEAKRKRKRSHISENNNSYTPSDLAGLKVNHSYNSFDKESILILKDSPILVDGEMNTEEDQLESITMVQNELFTKIAESKNTKGIYDLENVDLLSKYDREEQSGKAIVLNDSGAVSSSEIKQLEENAIRSKLSSSDAFHYSLDNEKKTQSEYLTLEDSELRFPTKKKKKKHKKKQSVLESLPSKPLDVSQDHGSRGASVKLKLQAVKNNAELDEKKANVQRALEVAETSNNLFFDGPIITVPDIDDAEAELQLSLSRARRMAVKQPISLGVSATISDPMQGVVFNSTSEFCHSFSSISQPQADIQLSQDDIKIETNSDSDIEINEEKKDAGDEEEEGAISHNDDDNYDGDGDGDNVPQCGVAAILKLASASGFLSHSNTTDLNNLVGRPSDIKQEQIDAKSAGNDPNQIRYFNDKGEQITRKEAFREISRKFHNNYPGKNRLEKEMRRKAIERTKKGMNSADTPLKMSSKISKITKKTGQAYIEVTDKKGVHFKT